MQIINNMCTRSKNKILLLLIAMAAILCTMQPFSVYAYTTTTQITDVKSSDAICISTKHGDFIYFHGSNDDPEIMTNALLNVKGKNVTIIYQTEDDDLHGKFNYVVKLFTRNDGLILDNTTYAALPGYLRAKKNLSYRNTLTDTEISFPTLSRVSLSMDDLVGFSFNDLFLMRNEIFARHGYDFQDSRIKEFFSQFKWYSPSSKNTDKKLNTIEANNVSNIKTLETNISSVYSTYRLKENKTEVRTDRSDIAQDSEHNANKSESISPNKMHETLLNKSKNYKIADDALVLSYRKLIPLLNQDQIKKLNDNHLEWIKVRFEKSYTFSEVFNVALEDAFAFYTSERAAIVASQVGVNLNDLPCLPNKENFQFTGTIMGMDKNSIVINYNGTDIHTILDSKIQNYKPLPELSLNKNKVHVTGNLKICFGKNTVVYDAIIDEKDFYENNTANVDSGFASSNKNGMDDNNPSDITSFFNSFFSKIVSFCSKFKALLPIAFISAVIFGVYLGLSDKAVFYFDNKDVFFSFVPFVICIMYLFIQGSDAEVKYLYSIILGASIVYSAYLSFKYNNYKIFIASIIFLSKIVLSFIIFANIYSLVFPSKLKKRNDTISNIVMLSIAIPLANRLINGNRVKDGN